MVINGYYINAYCDYFIGGYWRLLMVIISMLIVTILLVDIGGYWWLLMVIISMPIMTILLVDIGGY